MWTSNTHQGTQKNKASMRSLKDYTNRETCNALCQLQNIWNFYLWIDCVWKMLSETVLPDVSWCLWSWINWWYKSTIVATKLLLRVCVTSLRMILLLLLSFCANSLSLKIDICLCSGEQIGEKTKRQIYLCHEKTWYQNVDRKGNWKYFFYFRSLCMYLRYCLRLLLKEVKVQELAKLFIFLYREVRFFCGWRFGCLSFQNIRTLVFSDSA